MKTYLANKTQNENIETAKNLLLDLGVNMSKVSFSGYSDTNGVSVYFRHFDMEIGSKIRVSGHGISNRERMETTICFSFDANVMSLKREKGQKYATVSSSVKSNFDKNKMFLNNVYSFLKK